jgi:hypothetical protein
MNKPYIDYQGVKYPISELTIEKWQNIMKWKNILDDVELYIRTISELTGLSPEQIKESDAEDIFDTGQQLYYFINQESKEVYYNIKHNDVEYELCDFSNMSFGQFVDIDTFMSKDEAYRISNLNELASYLFTEKGKKYGQSDFKKKAESFKQLPFKFVEGGVFFLWTLERALPVLTQVYSENRLLWKMAKMKIIFQNFGATMSGFLNSRRTRFGKLMTLLVSPLFFVSTICRSLMTYIRNKIKR